MKLLAVLLLLVPLMASAQGQPILWLTANPYPGEMSDCSWDVSSPFVTIPVYLFVETLPGQVETVAGQIADTFVYPMDIAWMTDGRLIVADAGSNLLRTWRPGEPVATLSVRGTLATPHGVASGPDGTLYVADMKSHRVVAIDAAGAITTVAGIEGQPGSDATHLNRPAAVLVHAGWLWIADLDNHRICAVALK